MNYLYLVTRVFDEFAYLLIYVAFFPTISISQNVFIIIPMQILTYTCVLYKLTKKHEKNAK